ncbi:MAG: 6-phosphogluconolactonase, partial [Candidatus Binatia bacterium]
MIAADAEDLSRRAADGLAALVAESPSTPVTIALSGGSTPKRLYETLAKPPFAAAVPWARAEVFFGDERAVPPDHADSNFAMVERALLGEIPIVTHRMRAEAGEAEAYEQKIRERVALGPDGVPSFDLILLGIGQDGHTASLFPGTAATTERTRLVVMNDVPKLATRRMTFTYPLLNAAKRVWVLAAGSDKRDIVGNCLGSWDEAGAAERYP